jgi:hypothetical protein
MGGDWGVSVATAGRPHLLAADVEADGLLLAGRTPGLSAEERAGFEQKRLTALAFAQIERSAALASPDVVEGGSCIRNSSGVGSQPKHMFRADEQQGEASEAERWDAQAEWDVGVFMRRYLKENPPPDGAVCAEDFHRWSEDLRCDGQARLQELGAVRLRAL